MLMTGVRRAKCDCCGVTTVGCGIGNSGTYASFCDTVTDSECPSTITVTGTIPAYDKYITCGKSTQLYYSLPAKTFTIACSMDGSQNCSYSGSLTETVSITQNPCSGSGNSWTTRTITITIAASSSTFFTNAILLSPCCDDPTDAPNTCDKCCGIWVGITDGFTGTASTLTHYRSWGFKDSTITDCDAGCPCVQTYAGGAGDTTAKEPSDINMFSLGVS
tara:strand:- start:225 stop:881 length:657 start_codon:yes stop_codon:yes gene_type:complete